MKDLLIKLQQHPKTWEKFVKYCKTKNCYYSELAFSFVDAKNEYKIYAILEKLLTDFCDGEGYHVLPSLNADKQWVTPIRRLKGSLNHLFYVNGDYTSRQEAFNAGVEKSFELMEERNK